MPGLEIIFPPAKSTHDNSGCYQVRFPSDNILVFGNDWARVFSSGRVNLKHVPFFTELKQITTAMPTRTSPNEKFNAQNNSCTRACVRALYKSLYISVSSSAQQQPEMIKSSV